MPENTDRTLADQIFGDQAVKNDEQTEQTTQTQTPEPGHSESGKTGEQQTQEGQQQENQQQEQSQENKQQQTQADKLLAGKYKTPEELEKAYIEGQKWWTKSSQEVSQLRRDLEDLQKQVAPEMTKRQEADFKKQMQQAINMAVVDENPEALTQLIQDLVDKRAEAKVKERYQGVDPLVEQNRLNEEVNAWISENSEAAEHLADMQKLLDADPSMMNKPGWLDRAYAKVLNQKIGLTRKAKGDAAAQTQAEKAAAAITGSGARPSQTIETEEQKIVKGIFGEPGQDRGIFDD